MTRPHPPDCIGESVLINFEPKTVVCRFSQLSSPLPLATTTSSSTAVNDGDPAGAPWDSICFKELHLWLGHVQHEWHHWRVSLSTGASTWPPSLRSLILCRDRNSFACRFTQLSSPPPPRLQELSPLARTKPVAASIKGAKEVAHSWKKK